MNALFLLTFLLGFISLSSVEAKFPDEPVTDWQQVRAKQPPGLTITLTLPKDHYFLGELILGKVAIKNTAPGGYVVSDLDPGQAGSLSRLRYFAADSDGQPVVDPLKWAEWALQNLGGLFRETDLGTWSDDVVTLNNLRFDRPGRYTIWVWTDRPHVGTAYKPGKPGTQGPSVSLVSDKLTITIEPRTAAEEAQVMADAQAMLRQPATSRTGALELSALQTPGSHAILRTLISDDDQTGVSSIAEFGLMESPDPKAEGAALLDDVASGKVPVGRTMQWVYSWLERGESTNMGPGFEQEHTAAFDRILQAGQKASGGHGPAYAETVWVAYSGMAPERDPNWPAARAAFVAHQLEIKQEHKERILQMWKQDIDFHQHNFAPQWEGDDLLPLVREAVAIQVDPPDFYGKPHGKLTPEQMLQIQQYSQRRTVRDDGLVILANTRPAEARPIILADLQLPESRFFTKNGPYFPQNFPVMPMPELDGLFRARLAGKEDFPMQLFWLIDHFGSPAIEKDFLAAYVPDDRYPQLRASLVSYLKRCDPGKAGQYDH